MRTFFSDLASRGSFLIDGSKIYFFSHVSNKNRIYFPKTEIGFGLIPGGELEELLRFDLHLKKDEIYNIKKEYIKKNVKYTLLDEKEREKVANKKEIISFIVNELMPYMNGYKENISEFFGEKQENNDKDKIDGKEQDKIDEKELEKMIKKTGCDLRMALEVEGKFRSKRKNKTDYLLAELPGDRSLILDNFIYSLPLSDLETSQIAIKLGENLVYTMIKPFASVKKVESKFFKYLTWYFKSEAIDEFTEYIEKVHRASLESRKDIEKIMDLAEYNEGDIGFLQKDEKIYVYQTIPPFAMIDPRPAEKGTCCVFPNCRVGMKIDYNGNRLYIEHAMLFEAIWHPFTNNKKGEFQRLCFFNGDGVPDDKYSNVELVARKLNAAKNLVMNGLTPESIKRHNNGINHWSGSLDDIFEGRKIKINEAREKGLLITNNWEWKK